MTGKKEIKLILIDRDLTIAELARRVHRSRTWTSQVLYGHETSVATRKAIARTLGMKVSELWPKNNKHKEAA